MHRPNADLSRNGAVNNPPPLVGQATVSAQKSKRTEFPPEIPIRTFRTASYAGQRFLIGGIPSGRYITLLFLALIVLWATGLFPGRWTVVALSVFAIIAHIAIGVQLKRRDFSTFVAEGAPAISPAKYAASDSSPVYVTGLLSVEGREQRFTALPGVYKTFATREHALMCLVRARRIGGIIRWPVDEVGMWYAFFEPSAVHSVLWGRFGFGAQQMHAIAVAYEYCRKPTGRILRKGEPVCSVETLFISSEDEATMKRITADLMADELPIGSAVTPMKQARPTT